MTERFPRARSAPLSHLASLVARVVDTYNEANGPGSAALERLDGCLRVSLRRSHHAGVVEFVSTDDGIRVNCGTTASRSRSFHGQLFMDADSHCRILVDGVTLTDWQFCRLALDSLFFPALTDARAAERTRGPRAVGC